MKIKKLNEITVLSNKYFDLKYNYTKYIFQKTSPEGIDLITMPFDDIQKAIETYNRIYKKDENYYTIIKKTSEIITPKEIELLTQSNKYNL